MRFKNADIAFSILFDYIMQKGSISGNTKRILNTGFYIDNPADNIITCEWRKWKLSYAKLEYEWYLSENRSVSEIKKVAKLWDTMHSGDDIVNSNYGWLWNRNDQLEKVISLLKANNETRRAYITLFDGKEMDGYAYDTPCTLNVGFIIENDKLCMNVHMRSNDLVHGFCNDQYCFSMLQQRVATILGLELGWYYHHANDLHIYERHFKLHK